MQPNQFQIETGNKLQQLLEQHGLVAQRENVEGRAMNLLSKSPLVKSNFGYIRTEPAF